MAVRLAVSLSDKAAGGELANVTAMGSVAPPPPPPQAASARTVENKAATACILLAIMKILPRVD
jgi:hypothetical protein